MLAFSRVMSFVLRLDDFKENVACLGASGYAALVAVGDVAFCHLLARAIS